MKRGRPFSDNKKKYAAKVNFNKETYDELSRLCEKTGKSRSVILREAFEIYYMYVGSFLKKKGD